ncbi:MAG: glycoside hydrolase family 3 protein [Acidobacteriales bacterium]|nr:glycoside hydrolase family 3 protein [Terriglobales bacterium]
MSARDLRRLAGQLLIAGFDGTAMTTGLQSFLGEMQPGGVILFARNLVSAEQCHDLITSCRKRATNSLFTCVDLEGGTVDRFRDILAPNPSQREVSAAHDPALATLAGKTLGTCARALGFNTDFAPVSDIGFDASKSVLGSRAVSADPAETTAYVRRFLAGLRSAGVLGCGKHFPGLGEGNLDSHSSLPVIDKPWKRLWSEDLMPYRKSHRQMPFIMVAHAAYPAVTGDNTPASISRKWITEVLRKRIGYRGLIVSDDMPRILR